MSQQIRAIVWAQFRTIRNYLPRTSWGAVLLALLSLLWYSLFIGLGGLLAVLLPKAPFSGLKEFLPAGLLGLLILWQVFPVMTMSSGWSLELNKLLVYPIHTSTLFLVEVLLRLTTAPEAVFVLLGVVIGLQRHPAIHGVWPLALLLFLPFNLFLSLAIREWMLRLFKKKRLREVLVLVIVLISVLPQLLTQTSLGKRVQPFYILASRGSVTPWHEFAVTGLGVPTVLSVCAVLAWVTLAYLFAKRQFARSMLVDFGRAEAFSTKQAPDLPSKATPISAFGAFVLGLPGRLFRDPYAALIEKELRSLVRTPRFRVVFGMACVFSALIFFPMAFGTSGARFMARNYLAFINTYGMLIVGDVLLWNIFGFDRRAAQLYFVTPVGLAQVIKAKNLAAAIFIALQTMLVTAITLILPVHVSMSSILGGLAISLVVALFFMSMGNYASVTNPRPVDPNQTFKRQAGGKAQLILLACYLCMAIPIGLAYLARWATGLEWTFFAVLAFDIFAATVFYFVSLDTVIAKCERNREQIIDALSKGADPIGLGL
jgi:ABC-2 type transport system permease protein